MVYMDFAAGRGEYKWVRSGSPAGRPPGMQIVLIPLERGPMVCLVDDDEMASDKDVRANSDEAWRRQPRDEWGCSGGTEENRVQDQLTNHVAPVGVFETFLVA